MARTDYLHPNTVMEKLQSMASARTDAVIEAAIMAGHKPMYCKVGTVLAFQSMWLRMGFSVIIGSSVIYSGRGKFFAIDDVYIMDKTTDAQTKVVRSWVKGLLSATAFKAWEKRDIGALNDAGKIIRDKRKQAWKERNAHEEKGQPSSSKNDTIGALAKSIGVSPAKLKAMLELMKE